MPAESLALVNNQLLDGAETDMFVTVWLCLLNMETGEGKVSNAGHEHPALLRNGKSYELVKYHHSPALGMLENMRFRERDFSLNPGDALFVYTDGVPEANNERKEFYGTDRMLAALNQEPTASAEQTIANVRLDLDKFVNGTEQFDDVTMLCLKYYGQHAEVSVQSGQE